MYLLRDYTLIVQVLAQPPYDLQLFFRRQPGDGRLHDTSHGGLVHRDKALVVHEGEESHDELTVHPIGDATMSWNRFTEILDLKGPFQARSEETAKRRDEGGEGGEDNDMELHRGDVNVRDERHP